MMGLSQMMMMRTEDEGFEPDDETEEDEDVESQENEGFEPVDDE